MSTVRLVDENTTNPKVRKIFEDLKATKRIDRVPNIWRALATHPEHLGLCWTKTRPLKDVDIFCLVRRATRLAREGR
jgi:hypothetical protein